MAEYGFDFYGSAVYGDQSPAEFVVGSFRASPGTSYGRVDLSWQNASGSWDGFRLVRNFYGHPSHVTEGELLLDTATPPSSYVDTDVEPGEFVYYAIFLHDTVSDTWVRSGVALALPWKNFGSNAWLYSLMPAHIRDGDVTRDTGQGGLLYHFLSILALGVNVVKTEYGTLRDLRNIDRVAGSLLPLHAELLGYEYEPAVGMPQQRVLLRNAVYLSKAKGTLPGVEGVASAYTGWGAEVVVGKNLMLSSEKYIWTGTNTTSAEDGEDPADSSVRTLEVTAAGSGDSDLRSSPTGAETLWGIPVVAGTLYGFSCETYAVDSVRNVTLDIEWYDKDGVLLSNSASTPTANAIGSWTTHETDSSAPANARYAVVSVTFGGTGNGEVVHVKSFQFEEGVPSSYEHPRLVYIDMDADRNNLCTNPSFEVDTVDWSAGANTSIARVTSDAYVGAASLQLTASGAGDVSTLHTVDNRVTGGRLYTFSAYVNPGTGRDYQLNVRWEGSGGSFISNTTGTPQSISAGGWSRVASTHLAPIGALDAIVTLVVASAAAAETHLVDAVLFEQSDIVDSYFDGSQLGADALWSGTPHASESFYYFNRATRDARLSAILPDFLPPDRLAELRYAQPA